MDFINHDVKHKVNLKNRNRIMELAQLWDKKPNDVLNELLDKALGFYKYEFTNAGTKWSERDDIELVYLFKNGMDYHDHDLSWFFKRTKGAIMSRLCTLGYLKYNSETRIYTKTGKK